MERYKNFRAKCLNLREKRVLSFKESDKSEGTDRHKDAY
jgi:hypothetical protein